MKLTKAGAGRVDMPGGHVAQRRDDPKTAGEERVALDLGELFDRLRRARLLGVADVAQAQREGAEDAAQPRRRLAIAGRELRERLAGAGLVSAEELAPSDLVPEARLLRGVRARGEQALGRVLVPGEVVAERGEHPRGAGDGRLRNTARRRLLERRLGSLDVLALNRPNVRGEQKHAALGFVPSERLGRGLERARQRRRLLAVAEQIEQERARGDARWIGLERVAQRTEGATAFVAERRRLRDAEPQRRRARAAHAAIQLDLGDRRGARRVARGFEGHQARPLDRARTRESRRRAIEHARDARRVADPSLYLRGAVPEIRRVLALAKEAGDAVAVAALAVLDRLFDQVGLAFEGARERFGVVVFARELLEHDLGAEARLAFERRCRAEELVRAPTRRPRPRARRGR